jgi:hypothetical protein
MSNAPPPLPPFHVPAAAESAVDGGGGGGPNLAALRAMAAPSESDGSGDFMDGSLASALPSSSSATAAAPASLHASENTRREAAEAAEATLLRMEGLWSRVQELEIEHALLRKAHLCLSHHTALLSVSLCQPICPAFSFALSFRYPASELPLFMPCLGSA